MNVPKSQVFNLIAYGYNRAVLLEARRWEKLACRIAACYQQLTFLHTCLREDLPPKSLRKKPVVNSVECRQALRQYQRRTVRALINDHHRRARTLKTWAQHHRERCSRDLSEPHFDMLCQHIQSRAERTDRQTTTRLQNKVNHLRESNNNCPTDKLVHNLSSVRLTPLQLALLQRDVGHNLTDAHLLDFVAALEPALHHTGIKEDSRGHIKQQVTGMLMRHRNYQALPRGEAEALEQLRKDDTIVILPADKGRATVVIDKTLYVTKALELLDDRTAYKIVERDPRVMMRNKTNKILDSFKRAKKLDEGTLRRIRPNDSALPRFYGLPKIHKEGTPLRPIVSFRGTPMAGLAKWLSGRISHLVDGSPTTVKSAEEFLERAKFLRVEEDEVMVSFDVTSLFTSIPQELAVTVIGDLLNKQGDTRHQDSLQPKDLIKLLEICLATYFNFQGTTYAQVKGTPMGSPISSVVAEAVLQQLEHVAMAQYRPKFWARYVDDTFVVIKRCHKTDFMGVLNSVYPDIKFTVEEEDRGGSIAFLDVLVQRSASGHINTKVYRKPTHTDRILHYNSNHPVSHKASCIRTLFKRIRTHCSTTEAKIEERKYLHRVCRRNGYPLRFTIRHSRAPGSQRNTQNEEPRVQTTRVTLPYINNVSEATARLLAPYNVKVAHKPSQTLRAKVMRPKDPLPMAERSAIIYQVDCMDCQSNYVGETSKRLGTRLHEHKLAIKRGEQHSQMWSHMAEYEHRFDFDHARILASDATKGGRLLKEAWFSGENSINRHIEMCQAQQTLRSWHTRHHPQPHKRLADGLHNQDEDNTHAHTPADPREGSATLGSSEPRSWTHPRSQTGDQGNVRTGAEESQPPNGNRDRRDRNGGEEKTTTRKKGEVPAASLGRKRRGSHEEGKKGMGSEDVRRTGRGGDSEVYNAEQEREVPAARPAGRTLKGKGIGLSNHQRDTSARTKDGGVERPKGETKRIRSHGENEGEERRKETARLRSAGNAPREISARSDSTHTTVDSGGQRGEGEQGEGTAAKGREEGPMVFGVNGRSSSEKRRHDREKLKADRRETHSAQCSWLGPVTRSRSRMQTIGEGI